MAKDTHTENVWLVYYAVSFCESWKSGGEDKKYSFCILFVLQVPSLFILQNLIEIAKCEINGLLVLVPICSMKRGAQPHKIEEIF